MIKTTGTKYEATKELDIKEIAKLIRADIKAMIKTGELPAGKYAVTISRYSMGQSLTIRVTDLPFPVRVEGYTINTPHTRAKPWFTPEAVCLEEDLDAILQAYNQKETDWQSDYCNTHFFGHVNL
jgi:hypothetical protein